MKLVHCLLILGLASTTWAEPPRVVKAVPDNGATGVDPLTREIRVTFDQPMGEGFSFVGGGPAFPKTTGRPRWVDERTCVTGVQLEPGHDYRLSINSTRFAGFRNKAGEPAVPYPIAFSTAPDAPARPALTAEQNTAAVERLRTALQKQYSYREMRGVNWEKLLQERPASLTAAKTPRQFANETAKLLAAAKDMHIWLEVNGKTIPCWHRDVPRNINLSTLGKLVPVWKQRSREVGSGRFPDGIGYILIATWSRNSAVLEPALDALKDLADCKALIVDVRPNSGGAEPLAMKFAGCFIATPKAYAKDVTIQDGRFGPMRQRSIEPNSAGPAWRGKIAVLMGHANMSSCESFLLMMKQVPGCVLIGEKSFGSSGNPKPVDLGNGVTVYLPSWKDLLLDGTCFEGEGIAPDIEVKTKAEDFAMRDPVLEMALKMLRAK
jgi:Peptidase family S41/Bacterial Ig-like domain